ncbi:MAG: hypothetical protein KGH65_04195 [Candidatus Micrarchaeota archaeon]|nr:hypothetical protein [Candidatus Micrarchaeota archaeon]
MEKERGFLLLKPKVAANVKRIAKAIAMCKGVRDVFLTSGEYGFIATVETSAKGGIVEITKAVRKTTRSIRASHAVAHYIYSKDGWRR